MENARIALIAWVTATAARPPDVESDGRVPSGRVVLRCQYLADYAVVGIRTAYLNCANYSSTKPGC